MSKILLLGGSAQQIIAIETAKRLGYETVLCDYLPDNPGQYHADRFYLVSTTDKDAVLEVAKKEKIDGILAYASDPAAPTAAYVAERLGLPGNPYESVEILSNKDQFRAFLADNGFHTPKAKAFTRASDVIDDLKAGAFTFPVILKPVDSSGSKGVARIDDLDGIEDKLAAAMDYSRSRRLIVEEFVDKYGYQIAGDGLSINGKLVFRLFGNDHFDPDGVNPFVPVSASFPYNMPAWVHDKIHSEIQRLLTLLHMGNCTYNFDIRIDKDYNVYLMEIAPRDGGNYIPQVIKYLTGVDLVEYSLRIAMGEPIQPPKSVEPKGFASYYAVHSNRDGILAGIDIPDDFYRDHILEACHIALPGTPVKAFRGANTALGCYLMRFGSMEQMLDCMDHGEKWHSVFLSDSFQFEILDGQIGFDQILTSFVDCFPTIKQSQIDIAELSQKINEYGIVLLLKCCDNIAGFAAFYANDFTTNSAYLSLIAISSKYRRQGLGKRLLTEVCRIARDKGMKTLRLQVRDDNPDAQRFYSSSGFEYSDPSCASGKSYMVKTL